MANDTGTRNPEKVRDSGPASTTDRDQPSVLGGNVATRSGTSSGGEDTDGQGTGGMVEKRDAGGEPGEPGGRGGSSGG
jgi:hypothetical protein